MDDEMAVAILEALVSGLEDRTALSVRLSEVLDEVRKQPAPVINVTPPDTHGFCSLGTSVDGTLAATTYRVDLGPNLAMLMDQAYTDAQLIPLVKDWLARIEGHLSGTGAGGQKAETTKQSAVVATTCT